MGQFGAVGISLPEFLLLLLIALVTLVPTWRILARMGFSAERRWLLIAALVLLPGGGLIALLWLIAFADWPALDTARRA